MSLKDLIDWFKNLFGPRRPGPVDPPPPVPGDMLALHNAERQRRGAPPLAADARLQAAALAGVQFIARLGRGAVHPGSVGGGDEGDRATAAGYPWHALAENVDAGPGMTATQCFAQWMGDLAHQRNAMNPRYADVGFASAAGADGWTYWLAVYGSTK